MDNVELGKRIKELRKSRDLKQEDLAELLGISRGQISNLEHGRRGLDLAKLQKLCSYFKIPMEYFGIEPDTEEAIELLERAKLLFESEKVPENEKEKLFNDLMQLYLKFKGTI